MLARSNLFTFPLSVIPLCMMFMSTFFPLI
ncbi:hypothetical protein L610_007500000020 [Aminobacter sp. J44]|nr:hypothetical protein L610_007500000020 [Aminobacter sp. J44]